MKIRLCTAVAYAYVIYEGKTMWYGKRFSFTTTGKKEEIGSTRALNAVTEHLGAFCRCSDMGKQQHRDKD